MRILGIDPGLATVGIAIVDAQSPQRITNPEWLAITTPAALPFPERLAEIARDLEQILDEYKPEQAVVEKVFFSVNEKSAMDVAHARGVILQVLAARGIPLLEATPMQLKHAITGDGNADKKQIQTMLMHMFGLDEPPRPDDAADALGLAVYGAIHGTTAYTATGSAIS